MKIISETTFLACKEQLEKGIMQKRIAQNLDISQHTVTSIKRCADYKEYRNVKTLSSATKPAKNEENHSVLTSEDFKRFYELFNVVFGRKLESITDSLENISKTLEHIEQNIDGIRCFAYNGLFEADGRSRLDAIGDELSKTRTYTKGLYDLWNKED